MRRSNYRSTEMFPGHLALMQVSPVPGGMNYRSAATGRGRSDATVTTDIEGTVKWFYADKGFGFVVCEDGKKDVFLHMSVVERAGLRAVDEGQRLAMKVVNTQKGREAISFSWID